MMRKLIKTLVLVFCFLKGSGQDNYITKFQGYWVGYISTDPNSTRIFYEIIANNDKLSMVYERDTIIEIRVSKIGFVDSRTDSIKLPHLKSKGRFFCDCTVENDSITNCFLIEGFSSTGDSYWYGNTDVFDFNKVETLPLNRILTDFLKWEEIKLHHLQKFFNLKFKRIKASKSLIYSTPNKLTKMYFVQNDLVQLLEEKNDWLLIRYYGKDVIEGWIRKDDVE